MLYSRRWLDRRVNLWSETFLWHAAFIVSGQLSHARREASILPTNLYLKFLKDFEKHPGQWWLVTSARATVGGGMVTKGGRGVRIQWHKRKQMPEAIVPKEIESSTDYLTLPPEMGKLWNHSIRFQINFMMKL